MHYVKWGYDEEQSGEDSESEKKEEKKSEKKEGEEEEESTSKVKILLKRNGIKKPGMFISQSCSLFTSELLHPSSSISPTSSQLSSDSSTSFALLSSSS